MSEYDVFMTNAKRSKIYPYYEDKQLIVIPDIENNSIKKYFWWLNASDPSETSTVVSEISTTKLSTSTNHKYYDMNHDFIKILNESDSIDYYLIVVSAIINQLTNDAFYLVSIISDDGSLNSIMTISESFSDASQNFKIDMVRAVGPWIFFSSNLNFYSVIVYSFPEYSFTSSGGSATTLFRQVDLGSSYLRLNDILINERPLYNISDSFLHAFKINSSSTEYKAKIIYLGSQDNCIGLRSLDVYDNQPYCTYTCLENEYLYLNSNEKQCFRCEKGTYLKSNICMTDVSSCSSLSDTTLKEGTKCLDPENNLSIKPYLSLYDSQTYYPYIQNSLSSCDTDVYVINNNHCDLVCSDKSYVKQYSFCSDSCFEGFKNNCNGYCYSSGSSYENLIYNTQSLSNYGQCGFCEADDYMFDYGTNNCVSNTTTCQNYVTFSNVCICDDGYAIEVTIDPSSVNTEYNPKDTEGLVLINNGCISIADCVSVSGRGLLRVFEINICIHCPTNYIIKNNYCVEGNQCDYNQINTSGVCVYCDYSVFELAENNACVTTCSVGNEILEDINGVTVGSCSESDCLPGTLFDSTDCKSCLDIAGSDSKYLNYFSSDCVDKCNAFENEVAEDKNGNLYCGCSFGFININTNSCSFCLDGTQLLLDKFCESCSGGLFSLDNKCVTECASYSLLESNSNCVCSGTSYYLHKKDCVSFCPTSTIQYENNNGEKFCFDCPTDKPYVANNLCVSQCPEGYYIDPTNINNCIFQCESNEVMENGVCVPHCFDFNNVLDIHKICRNCSEMGLFTNKLFTTTATNFNNQCFDTGFCSFTDSEIKTSPDYCGCISGSYLEGEACVSECSVGYVLDPDYNSVCLPCPISSDALENNIAFEGSCVGSCPEYMKMYTIESIYYPNFSIYYCDYCTSSYNYYEGECYLTCTEIDSELVSIPILLSSSYYCSNTCLDGQINNSGICEDCIGTDLFSLDYTTCVNSCDTITQIPYQTLTCITCLDVLQDGICKATCDDKYYYNANKICEECPNYVNRFNNTCVDTCEYPTFLSLNNPNTCDNGCDYSEYSIVYQNGTHFCGSLSDCNSVTLIVDEINILCYECNNGNVIDISENCVSGCPTGYTLDTQSNHCVSDCKNSESFYDPLTNGCEIDCSDPSYYKDMLTRVCIENAFTGSISYVINYTTKEAYRCSKIYYNLDTNTCVDDCSSNLLYESYFCVVTCPESYIEVSGACNPCDSTELYVYNNVCQTECPINTYTSGYKCLECPSGEFIYANQCVTDCPLGLGVEDLYNCDTCTTNPYIDNNYCVATCANFAENSYCVDECSSGKGIYTTSIECVTCDNGDKKDPDQNCVASCSSGLGTVLSSIDCVDCSIEGIYKYLFDDECLINCPNEKGVLSGDYICDDCDNVIYNNECVSNCPTNTGRNSTSTKMCGNCNSNYFIDDEICVSGCSSGKGTYYNGSLYCENCPSNATYVQNNLCVSQCSEGYGLNADGVTCASCPSTKPYSYDNNCYSKCPIKTALASSSSKQCVTCSSTQPFVYNNTCIASCPQDTGATTTNNTCVSCGTGLPYIYNNYCVLSCPTNTGLLTTTSKMCSSCPSTKPYILNNICSESCGDTKGLTSGSTSKLCIDCSSSQLLFSDGYCKSSTDCDITKYIKDISNKKCIDCAKNNTKIYNSKCVSSCPTNTTYLSSNNTCVTSTTNNNGSGTNTTTITCKSGYEKTIENSITLCRSCKYLGKYNENGTCVASCSQNTNLNTETNECLSCSLSSYLQYNNSTNSFICVASCDSTKGYYVDSESSRTCKNCVDTGKYIKNNQCVSSCGQLMTPISSICKSCSETDKKFILDGNCVSSCPENYRVLDLKGTNNVCSYYKKDPTCSEGYCQNNSTCSYAITGEIKCDCSGTNFFGSTCSLSTSQLTSLSNATSSSISNLNKITSLTTVNIQEVENIKETITNAPQIISNNMVGDLLTLASSQLSQLENNSSKISSDDIFNIVDTAFTAKKLSSSNTTVSSIKDSISNITSSILSKQTNLTQYLETTNGSLLYSGDSFTIQLTDNSEEYLAQARENKLPIVDYSQCEEDLKTAGLIAQDEKVYAQNLIYDASLLNNQTELNGKTSASNEISTILVNSKGEEIDTSICDSITVKMPVNNNIINTDGQLEVQDLLDVDVFNSNQKFFDDICFSFPYNNGSDITLSSRRDKYNSTSLCSEGCTYEGMDEHGYSLCNCRTLPSETIGTFKDSVFGSLENSNFMLFKCFSNIINSNIVKNVGLWSVLSISLIGSCAVVAHSIVFSASQAIGSIVLNDAITINPCSVGNIIKQYNNEGNKDNNLNNGIEIDVNSNCNSLRNSNNIDYYSCDNNCQDVVANQIIHKANTKGIKENSLAETKNTKENKNYNTSLSSDAKILNFRGSVFNREARQNKPVINQKNNNNEVAQIIRPKIVGKTEINELNKRKKNADTLILNEINSHNDNNVISLNDINNNANKIIKKPFSKNNYNDPIPLDMNSKNEEINYDSNNIYNDNVTENNSPNQNMNKIGNKNKDLTHLDLGNNQSNYNNDVYNDLKFNDNNNELIVFNNNLVKTPPIQNFDSNKASKNDVYTTNNQGEANVSNNNDNDKIYATTKLYRETTKNANTIYDTDKNNWNFSSESRKVSVDNELLSNGNNNSNMNVNHSSNYLDYKQLSSSQIKIPEIKTKADFEELPISFQLIIDKRSFFQFVWDDLKESHPYINLILVKSILNPFFIRITSLIFSISLEFALNAMFFTDSYINQQAQVKETEGEDSTGFGYVLLNEFSKSIWPVVITTIITTITRLILIIPKKYKEEFNEKLISTNKEVQIEGV